MNHIRGVRLEESAVKMSQKSNLDSGRELVRISQDNPLLGNLLRRIIKGITQTASNSGVSPVGESDPPPTIGAVNIKASGEIVHATINDAAPVVKGINYFVEAATEPNFLNPHVEDLGTSRGKFFNLPSLTDTGGAQTWYFRGYSQYLGSKPSTKIPYGGLAPTGVTLTGSTQLTPLSSTGSGTAASNGSQGGQGFGNLPIRPAVGPKRNVS